MNMTILDPVVQAKAEIFTPILFIVWLSYVIGSPILTWMYKSKRTGWGSYWKVHLGVTIISGIIVGFATFSPETIANFFNSFSGGAN